MTEFFDPAVRSQAVAASPGDVLRRAREAAGLHIAALAVSLKVPVKKLEALEADRFDLLPDAVFVRALAGSVCRSLKLDPQTVLPLLPKSGTPRLGSGEGERISPTFRTPSFGSRNPWWGQVSRPAVLAGLALLLGAGSLFLLPEVQDKKEELATAEAVPALPPASPPMPLAIPALPAAPSAAVVPDSVALAAVPTPPAAAAPVAAPAALTLAAVPAAGLPAAALPAKPASTAASVANPATPAPTAAASAAVSQVTFTTSKTSWVEVVDARGTTLLRRQLAAGEVVGVGGVLPLKALVGRADGTQVQVRGQTLDLTPLSKDNVARFEVK